MVYLSKLELGDGGGNQSAYVEASSPEEAIKKHLDALDNDVHEWRVISSEAKPSELPGRYNKKPTPWGLYKIKSEI